MVPDACREFELAQIAIDSYCNLIELEQNLDQLPDEAVGKLGRAINLALGLRDPARAERVRDLVLKPDSREACYPHGAGTAFEFLLIRHKKVPLDASQRETLIRNHEAVLGKSVEYAEQLPLGQANPPIRAQNSGLRLAHYYRSMNQKDQLTRVMALYARAHIASAKSLPAMMGAHWLQTAYKFLTEFRCRPSPRTFIIVAATTIF